MEDVKEKACPFRVHSVQHMPMLRGNGPSTTQEFYPCMGEGCAAYYRGMCMRLSPPAMVIDDFTDDEATMILKQASQFGIIAERKPTPDEDMDRMLQAIGRQAVVCAEQIWSAAERVGRGAK